MRSVDMGGIVACWAGNYYTVRYLSSVSLNDASLDASLKKHIKRVRERYEFEIRI